MKKSKTKALTKVHTKEDMEDLMNKLIYVDHDPEYILRDVEKNILPKLKSINKREKESAMKLLQERSRDIASATGLTNHIHVSESVDKRYKIFVLSMVKQIEKDYNCVSAAEKALAELAAIAHVSVIDGQRRMKNLLGSLEEVHDGATRYIAVLSKQIDRAQRQFLTAITTLKQMKQPQLEVNIRAKAAFVSQNQQINVNQKDNEIIQSE